MNYETERIEPIDELKVTRRRFITGDKTCRTFTQKINDLQICRSLDEIYQGVSSGVKIQIAVMLEIANLT